ncbi:sugar phosphate isomerase/epimerase family protein [Oryzibacter oryziterrae]|uniref:sugar phosphate isomerase/epimerase family protein n=1 Tax=Oryzibacter oryziterrae TaxID=2766474 RepID=UPI001F3448AF|nr:sugar phosphate isomerase/epimerase [Oryzibacter oryziterrae]
MALEHPFSMQLFSARNFPPLADQLRLIRSLGYTNVEPFGGLYGDLDALSAGLKANDLTACSGHFGIDMLENDLDGAVRVAERLGMKLIVCPYLLPDRRPVDGEGWRRFGDRLSAIAGKVKARGFRFAWHNHDFEFLPLKDGSLPIQHIVADPAVDLELDLAWVVRAGVNPLPWLEGYAGRIAAVHVKDIALPGTADDEDGWADVGFGTLGWSDLWPVAAASGANYMVAEHDNPSDFARFARRSLASMKSLAGA